MQRSWNLGVGLISFFILPTPRIVAFCRHAAAVVTSEVRGLPQYLLFPEYVD
jgi:hypothetical protein